MAIQTPDDFSAIDLLRDPQRLRDMVRFVEQMKRLEIIAPNGKKVPLLYSNTSTNAVIDLRNVVTAPAVALIQLSIVVNDPTSLDLTWTLPDVYDQMFLERSPNDNTAFAALVTLGGTVTTHSDTTPTPGTTYFYRVRGVKAGVFSEWSNEVSGALTASVSGTLWGSGYNTYGQIGDASNTDRTDFTQESLTSSIWVKVVTGLFHSLALRSDGTIWSTGGNFTGQLGQGNVSVYPATTNNLNVFTQIGSATDWDDVWAGGEFSAARKTSGELYTWGANGYGQLGLGDNLDRSSPAATGVNCVEIAGGVNHLMIRKSDGTVWGSGGNNKGQLGDGGTTDTNTFTQETTGATTWASIGCGEFHTIGIKSDGTIWTWGSNNLGELGNGTTSVVGDSTPTQRGTDTNWAAARGGGSGSAFQFTLAKKTNGTLYNTGWNFTAYSGGSHFFTSFTQVGSATDWNLIGGGGLYGAGIKTDGSIWVWGDNQFGQLGLGFVTGGDGLEVTPVQVGSATDWLGIASSSSENYHACALRTP